MTLFTLRSDAEDPLAKATRMAREDALALRAVVAALHAASTRDGVITAALDTVREGFGWAYASFWRLDPEQSALVFDQQSGTVDARFQKVTQEASFARGVGFAGRAWQRGELVFVEDLAEVTDCVRAPAARDAGVKSGVCFPVLVEGSVVGTMDFFTTWTMSLPDTRRAALEAVADLVGQALTQLHQTEVAQSMAEDSRAVAEVLGALATSTDEQSALAAALESVRREFGWDYGSVWKVNTDGVLAFDVESGSVNQQFRDVTRSATFRPGVGLSGRAWRDRRLLFVADLAEVTDCVRAPAARDAGVKSGVVFPIEVDGEIVATMDFFAMRTLALSENRSAALISVGRMVGQTMGRLRRADRVAQMADELSASVQHVAQGAGRASAVASEAVAAAEAALAVMTSLQASSKDIGDIAKVIAGIAAQTNLLALNATIEAARAGESGKGFAVVAQEVKELSRETSTATDDATGRITSIRSDSAAATAAIESIGETIRQIHEIQNDLASVLEEQATIAQEFAATR
ncbi:GAF domain-containing protein [Spongisporangium articulatum]|uniref:GAF domain-containing protein n=1 Tax=Spongisporangium articulatum TaxID=3362603 RepID=A0ABW8AM91_9ACTN